MKKKTVTVIAVIAVIIILIFAVIGSYNGLVDKRENVEEAHSAISAQLQRRADLIPNFVATVQGYADYEKSTLTAVTEARASVASAKGASEEAAASEQLDKAISVWVNAVTEAYPELKSNTHFTALMDELSGTENRITTARKDYNKVAKSYNSSIKKFPKSIIASLFGFDAYDYFEASAGAENVPQVSFK